MGWRSEIERKATVTCRKCGTEWLDWHSHPNRKWNDCAACVRKEKEHALLRLAKEAK